MAEGEQKRSAADESAAEAQSVGQALKKARAAQDLSLEQLAAELRIEPQQLVALEADKFDRIGVPVFVKGDLRQYGTRLGLDPKDLLAIYYKQGKLDDVDIRPSRAIKLRDEQQITVWIIAAVVLLLIAAGLVVWWLEGPAGFAPSPAPQPTAPLEDNGPAATPVEPAPARLSEPVPAGGAPAAAVAGAPRAAESPAASEPLLAAPVSAPAPSDPLPPTGDQAQPQAEPEPSPPAPLPPLSADAIDLDFTFAEESWVEISDARGERLFFGTAESGRRVVRRGDPPFSVLLGNANGVQLLVDGTPYEIPRSRQGNLARFTLEVVDE
jgi:cytoskeleton protein RodZ